MRWPEHIKGPYWEPRDVWFGVYWDRGWISNGINKGHFRRTDVYVCLIPCFPVRLIWTDRQPAQEGASRE